MWQAPQPPPHETEDPTFHEFASRYLAARKGELDDNTYKDYRWRLVNHLLPFFADARVSAIDVKAVDDYRFAKVTERDRIRAALDSGAILRDAGGRRIRPLSNESINKTLAMLASVLDIAVDQGLLTTNPARGKRRRLKVARPRRPFLESDEIASLLAAAEDLDRAPFRAPTRAVEVRRLRDVEAMTFAQIAQHIGVSLSTAHYYYGRPARDTKEAVLLRRTVIAVLVGAGLRVSELCALSWRDVNLRRARITIPDAKTDAGIREVRLTKWCVGELVAYRASLSAAEPGAPVFPTSTGAPRDRTDVSGRIVKRAAARSDEMRLARGLAPLPQGITPHALRCTYISLLLEAGYSLPYVMAQVGHEDESTTLRIYARVLKRRARAEQDEAFDRLIDDEVA